MNFGQALEALKSGKKVARKGWNGKNMFLYLTKGSTIQFGKLKKATQKALKGSYDEIQLVDIGAHIDMKAADGTIVVGWLASQTDMLAEDWLIVE